MNNWNKDFVYENWKKGRKKVLKDIVVGFIAITIIYIIKYYKYNRLIICLPQRTSKRFAVLLILTSYKLCFSL